ncbi:MAG: circadian clock KaiB family protein [Burkholderiales bacterium]|nr:circadian clock KaiB family protein [Burkholderiales bacterium]
MARRARFKFRIYVAGEALNSVQALANLRSICLIHLPNRHGIEIVDVFKQPERALADGIFMTPTLVKLSPSPATRIVGSLSHLPTVLQALGLEAVAA